MRKVLQWKSSVHYDPEYKIGGHVIQLVGHDVVQFYVPATRQEILKEVSFHSTRVLPYGESRGYDPYA